MKTQLTAEESAKLIELGVSPERASNKEKVYVSEHSRDTALMYQVFHHYAPIFTLTDILDILPKEIDGKGIEIGYDRDEWYAGYNDITLAKSYFFTPELIDALYSLLVWCLEKGYEYDYAPD